MYLALPLLKQQSTEVVDHDMESIGVGRVRGWRQGWGGVGDAICGFRSGLKVGFFFVDSGQCLTWNFRITLASGKTVQVVISTMEPACLGRWGVWGYRVGFWGVCVLPGVLSSCQASGKDARDVDPTVEPRGVGSKALCVLPACPA